jgi:hypothetical protein
VLREQARQHLERGLRRVVLTVGQQAADRAGGPAGERDQTVGVAFEVAQA